MREFGKRWMIVGADAKTLLGRVFDPEAQTRRELGAERQAAGGANSLLTFPSGEPTKWIDYVLVRPAERWEVVEVRVIEERIASDHRPLLAVLRRLP
jgi:endonuclease/exonuclease/phosphatase family metal-dependent hydrolase